MKITENQKLQNNAFGHFTINCVALLGAAHHVCIVPSFIGMRIWCMASPFPEGPEGELFFFIEKDLWYLLNHSFSPDKCINKNWNYNTVQGIILRKN